MKEDSTTIKRIARMAKLVLRESKNQSVSHRWDHAERVYRNTLMLVKGKSVIDLEVLKIAALLHDIDHPYDKKKDHAQRSVRKARQVLRMIGYPEHKMIRVLEVMSTHSSEDIRLPATIEGKILLDADKLDGVGATGIARVFTFCGQCGMTPDQAIEWYKQKIKIAAPLLQTEKGKKLISERLGYVRSFLGRYEKEKRNTRNLCLLAKN